MSSPPRSFARPPTPATPSKAARPRPRISTRPPKTHLSCRRCLFGPVDHNKISKWLQDELKTLYIDQQERWNFDFSTMTPLPGGEWKWEKVSVPLDGRNSQPKSPVDTSAFTFDLPVKTTPLARSSSVAAAPARCDSDDEGAIEAGPSPAKRRRVNDENANPKSPAKSRPRCAVRTLSINSNSERPVDSGSGAAAAPLETVSGASVDVLTTAVTSPGPMTPSTLLTPASLASPSSPASPLRFTFGSPLRESHHKPVFDQTTPKRPLEALVDLSPPAVRLPAPPPRSSRSGKRVGLDAAPSAQKRLVDYFAVKRRGNEPAASGSGDATRKRINFDA